MTDAAKSSRAIFLTLVLTACGATNGGARFDVAPQVAVPEVSTARASSPEVGVVSLISDAIAQLKLTPEQNRDLNGLVNTINGRHDRVQDARKTLALDMAHAVETAAVDRTTLLADADRLGKARAAIAADDGKSLEALHRILTPEQRTEFATAMKARADKLPTDDAQTRYGNWRSDLEINLAQNERIAPKLDADTSSAVSARAEREAWQKRLRATAADFDKETFTAAPFLDPDVVATTTERVRRVIGFLEIVVPALDEKQRKLAADNLRAEVGVPHD